jgi:hypothetical protein
VQVTSHLGVDKDGTGGTNPGVGVGQVSEIRTGSQGKFLSRLNEKKVQCKGSWTAACWSGGTQARIDEQRAKELQDMIELLKLPIVDGSNVLLLMQSVTVKHGPAGELAQITVFWDDGSTCSLILTERVEVLGCPGEPVNVTIDTINGILTRDTKLYCVELMNNSGERVIIKAFGVESISEVHSIVEVAGVKQKFSQEVQTQWGKVSKRPKGSVHLLVGQEYAGYHPVQYEAKENLVVCRSMFGQGWVLTGYDSDIVAEECTWGEEVAAMRVGRVTVVNQSNHRISGVGEASSCPSRRHLSSIILRNVWSLRKEGSRSSFHSWWIKENLLTTTTRLSG